MRDDVRRRDLLRTGVGLAGTTVLGGLAGCLGSIPGLGGGGGVPGYTNWLPAGGELGRDDDAYLFTYVDVAGIRDNADRFAEEEYESFTDRFGPENSGVPEAETVDAVTSGDIQGSLLIAIEGSFSADEAAEALGAVAGRTYEEAGEYGDYTLYAASYATMGVADGVVAGAFRPGGEGHGEWARTVLDAGAGDAERMVEASEDARTLAKEVGADLSARGTPDVGTLPSGYSPDDVAVAGGSVALNGDTAQVDRVLVYDEEGDVDVEAILDTAEDAGGRISRADDRSVTASGRVATVSGTADAADLTLSAVGIGIDREVDDERQQVIPSASFDFDYDQGEGVVTIVHSSGDTFTAENTGALRYGIEGGDLQRWSTPVSAGDSVELAVRPDDTVVVVWEAPDGGRTAEVADFRVPS